MVDASNLYQEVRVILDEARGHVARFVNVEMVQAYRLVGQTIVSHEQRGKGRADYGERLLELLAERLTKEFGKGFTLTNPSHS